jgi:hypothetical protein
MIVRQLVQSVLPEQVAAAIADMGHKQFRTEAIGHGHRGSHAPNLGVSGAFLDQPAVRLMNRCLQLAKNSLIIVGCRYMTEAAQRIQDEGFDRLDRERTGRFATAMPTDPIGQDEQMRLRVPALEQRLAQAGSVHTEDFCEVGDDKVIFVPLPHAPLIGETETVHDQ